MVRFLKLFDKDSLFLWLASKGFFHWMTDEEYLKRFYKSLMKKTLDLDNPRTFNEKLQWIKLHDRNPIYTRMVDKYEAKEYVSEILGKQVIIPTLGVYDSVEEINFCTLPEKYVLKCTHDSGTVVLCKNKELLNIKEVKHKLKKCLDQNYYWLGREWPYKNVKSRIIAEKYMIDNQIDDLRDYKFFCFNGKVKLFKVDFDRQVNHRANYYNRNAELLPFGECICPPDDNKKIVLPNNLSLMIEYAERLSRGIRFVRIDFYNINGDIFFGEMTFFPNSGCGPFTDDEWDKKLGDMINI